MSSFMRPASGPTSATAPVVTVFDPYPVLTITIEDREGADEVHLHAGGQGVWIGRMAASLGATVRLVTATGGEAGVVLLRLIAAEGIDAHGITTLTESAAYVHDRRSGGREELAEVKPPPLGRHELDDLYERALVESSDADAFVLAGPRPGVTVPEGTYRRLAADVGVVQPNLIADLSGAALEDALAAGTIRVLKLSDEELHAAGLTKGDEPDDVMAGICHLHENGAEDIVVTRGAEPTLALIANRFVEVRTPHFTPHDNRGGGDAMTAALALGAARDGCLDDALRFGAAAGALNVTRRGLASVEPDHVRRLAERVDLRPVEFDRRRA
jgi:1-phosphofructokinase